MQRQINGTDFKSEEKPEVSDGIETVCGISVQPDAGGL